MFEKLSFLKPGTGLTGTLKRFPLSVASCVVFFLLYVFEQKDWLYLVACSYFWFGAAALIAEKYRLSGIQHGALAIGGFVVLFLIMLAAAGAIGTAIYLVSALLLLITVVPFLDRQSDNEQFWTYNFTLWTGAIAAAGAAFIMMIGLLATMSSFQYLFGTKPDESYAYIWLFCMAIYAPVYALFYVPRAEVKQDINYAQSCKFLVNFILVPLICVYFLILYAYAGKILIEWEMPRGRLAGMVAGFGAIGVVTYLIAWPIRENGTKLLHFVQKNFFKALIVPLILMGIGLSIRIEQYGVTEQRYMAVIALVWLSFVTALFVFGHKFPLKIIPASLALLMFAASFGPWGAGAISLYSQLGRLNAVLVKNNLLVNGEIVPAVQGIPFEEEKNLSSIVDYFVKSKQADKLPAKLAAAADASEAEYGPNQKIMGAMNLKYVSSYAEEPDSSRGEEFQFQAATAHVAVVTGYDYMLEVVGNSRSSHIQTKDTADGKKIQYELKEGTFAVSLTGYKDLVFNLDNYAAKKLAEKAPREVDSMTLIEENDGLRGNLAISSIRGNTPPGDTAQVTFMRGTLLLEVKDQ